MKDSDRKDILGEALMDEPKAIHEYVQDIPGIRDDLDQVKIDVTLIKDKLDATSATVRDHGHQLSQIKEAA